MTLQEVLKLAKQLTPDLEKELAQQKPHPKRSLLGLCADLGTAPSAEEIDLTRRES